MAFDPVLGKRVAAALESSGIGFVEKRMFGGLAFMVNDKMCIGVVNDQLMVRTLDEKYADTLKRPHAREMDFTGRPMKGFVYVSADGVTDNGSLKEWIDLGIEFAKFGKLKSKRAKK